MARNTKTSKKATINPTKASAKKKTTPVTAKGATREKNADFQEVRTLIELLKKNDLSVLEFEQGDLRIILKTPAASSGGATLIHGHAPAAAPATSAPAVLIDKESPAEPEKGNFKEITSPMVGTFYAAPSPESPAFVEVGKTVNAETVVCIVEAMKVMNEIKAEISGKIVEVVAESGKPVQFGQVLFRVS
jgi:acetyl-CoA carboxylase biotin carboxyl carrier protein